MCAVRFLLLIIVIVSRAAVDITSAVSFPVSSDPFTVTGWYGDNVTLPCRYDAQAHGSLSFCWGRAKVPRSKCSSTILSVDGAVLFRQSPRYQLLGRVADGDVSLTVLNARWSDGGEYGCRVEIPGWFNDHKVNLQLVIEDAPAEEPTTGDMIVPTTQETAKTSTSVQEDDDGAAPADEAPLVAKIQSHSLLFENFLGVWNLCRLAAVFFFTIVTILVFAHSRGFRQRRTVEHPSSSAAENIYDSIPELQPTSSPHFYKT